MTITVRCPSCGVKLRIGNQHAGKREMPALQRGICGSGRAARGSRRFQTGFARGRAAASRRRTPGNRTENGAGGGGRYRRIPAGGPEAEEGKGRPDPAGSPYRRRGQRRGVMEAAAATRKTLTPRRSYRRSAARSNPSGRLRFTGSGLRSSRL